MENIWILGTPKSTRNRERGKSGFGPRIAFAARPIALRLIKYWRRAVYISGRYPISRRWFGKLEGEACNARVRTYVRAYVRRFVQPPPMFVLNFGGFYFYFYFFFVFFIDLKEIGL